jgi:hypothetical protein
MIVVSNTSPITDLAATLEGRSVRVAINSAAQTVHLI